jgi:two-component system chemotaxis sensor kinase CheA
MSMQDLHKAAFREEAYELLAELETALMELEENPSEPELIDRTFRSMHTIKGSGAMFGFTDISEFTHEVETVFDRVRNGKMSVNKELIDLTLKSCDLIRIMLDDRDSVDEVEKLRLMTAFKNMSRIGEESEAVNPKSTIDAVPSEAGGTEKTYRIRFKPLPGIFVTGTDPALLLDELRQLGECEVVAHLGEIPPFADLDPESCYTFWDIILTTRKDINAIKDVFIFVEDDCELVIDVVGGVGSSYAELSQKKLGEILVERGELAPEDMRKVLESKKKFGEILVEKGLASPSQVEAALTEQHAVREVQQKRQNIEAAASIRVPSEKLDSLVDLVGELVTVQARLSRMADQRNDTELSLVAEEVERLTAELRDNTLNIRMMPIGTSFSKLKRLVRDLSGELGKEVEMVTEGAETELDKTVIERLNDPLVHIIRNSIDHGIEAPEAREAAGKPRQGTVRLKAVHSGDSVLITIQDDGGGLNKEAIRSKAVERKLIAETADMSDKELFSLIFAPGFSTAKKVTGVSGRGVGMDVVKKAIEALRGTIDISSTKGQGTSITVKLPLTLAIIESLLVKIEDNSFIMPLSLVEECMELTRDDVARAHGRNLANVRGSLVPYIPLRERFKLAGDIPDTQQIVVTMVDGERMGFLVDTVVGEHQTVIKSLGKAYRNVPGVSGATILGDGSVALILDIPQMAKWS